MKNSNIKIRTDANVAFADELVHVPGTGRSVMRSGSVDAVPQPDRGLTRA